MSHSPLLSIDLLLTLASLCPPVTLCCILELCNCPSPASETDLDGT